MNRTILILAILGAAATFGLSGCGSAPKVDTPAAKVTPQRQAILDQRDRQNGDK